VCTRKPLERTDKLSRVAVSPEEFEMVIVDCQALADRASNGLLASKRTGRDIQKTTTVLSRISTYL
jgi:hypothetical protein